MTADQKEIIIYTDGSSRGNPGPGGWGSVVATPQHVYELAGFAQKTTNNRMELMAVVKSLQFLLTHKQSEYPIFLHTDSQYFKNGFEKWMYGWADRKWLTSKKEPVLNQDLWQELLQLKPLFPRLVIHHVRGHVGVAGNERADVLATTAADDQTEISQKSSRANYQVELKIMPASSTSSTKPKSKSKSSGKAFCYLSLVSGKLIEHDNWADCEARVKGQKGAKYRRANSAVDRDEIISSWNSKS